MNVRGGTRLQRSTRAPAKHDEVKARSFYESFISRFPSPIDFDIVMMFLYSGEFEMGPVQWQLAKVLSFSTISA